MLHKITAPDAGQTSTEFVITSWLKAEGELVKRGDALVEIETDKSTLAVESFAKGTLLKIFIQEGEKANVGDLLAYVGEQGDLDAAGDNMPTIGKPDDFAPIMKKCATEPELPVTALYTGEIKASPAAKKLAKDRGVSLSDVACFEGAALIKERHVEHYISQMGGKAHPAPNNRAFELIPLSQMRRAIAKRMSNTTATVPAYQLEIETDMESVILLRNLLKDRGEAAALHDILIKCLSAAIARNKLTNASFTQEGIRVYKNINVGIAVSLPEGLIVPVVKDVAHMGILEIAKESAMLIQKARENRLELSEYTGGTITISNLGIYPVSRFTAIINPPESVILALGSVMRRAVIIGGTAVERRYMNITASFDHRVIDGAYAAAFMQDLKELVENPCLALM